MNIQYSLLQVPALAWSLHHQPRFNLPMNSPLQNLLGSFDLTPDETLALVQRAQLLRDGGSLDFAGLVAALFFLQPSLRTRLSCESAMARYGGSAVAMTPGVDSWRLAWEDGQVMDGEEQEHLRELAPVASRMAHILGVRNASRIGGGGSGATTYAELAKDEFLNTFATHATVPVVNLESNRWHPLQGLSDQMTIRDRLGDARGQRYVLTWAWHPRALPVATPHSQLVAACDLGMDVVILRPDGWQLDGQVVDGARERARACGGDLRESSDPAEAFPGAKVVCVKSWGRLDRYGDPELAALEEREKSGLRQDWLLDEPKMSLTEDAFLMHCLPVRRNVVVADAVLDGPRSAVVDEAENRLWTAAAVFAELLAR
ncbi:MAG: N-acetylornithine carbamoyltransferase [Planctomycetota bacterium]|jgi:N-acetylornithine carbamoyltransferase